MKRRIPYFVAVLLLSLLTCGTVGHSTDTAQALTIYLLAQAPCPEQTFRDPATAPFPVDLTKIAIDPNTNRACFLGWTTAVVAMGWTWTAKICDPDSDLMDLTASAGTLKVNTDGTYAVTGTATAIGVSYVTMTLVDKPPPPLTPITRKGTFAVLVVPKNRPPSLCGGLP